ncbi:hypothetical protein BEL04_22015 [Mucilaginibacter sp. PPCGB 2223]|uniref:hypothetical protein n=1 Tax=Mucilaginibacter sp. PPCGB 2223 TaxID=1886027 RepID=UPI0008245214|nr:hypothetical protein [Mucilaginibacter sp. PPCGB 2223]OCX50460.1 hypothetical protein BEL04_22015 [Mucilaginibacter sp. PPCGB 2223]
MIKINIATANGFTTEELKKVEAANSTLNNILNSEKFRERVLKFTTDGLFRFHYRRSFFGKWIDKPHTNHQVYEIVTQHSGADDAGVKQIDLHLELLPGGGEEHIGYTDTNTRKIFTYRDWFNSVSLAEYAGHLTHEWCHQLGFDHSPKPDPKREHSVPYGIGSITEAITLNY